MSSLRRRDIIIEVQFSILEVIDMGKAGYAFMIAGALLIALPLYYAWMILTSQMAPITPFPNEPGIVDLSALWNITINFVVLSIMVKSGSALLQHGANATKTEA